MSSFWKLARRCDPAQKWDRDVEDHESAALSHDRWAAFWETGTGYLLGRAIGASRWAQGQRYRATELRRIANKMRTCIHRPLGAGAPDRRALALPIGVDSLGRTVYSITSLDDPAVKRPGRLVRLGKSATPATVHVISNPGDVDRETNARLAAKHRAIEDLLD